MDFLRETERSTPTTTHTRSAPSPEARGPPLGGSMRPCARAPRPHHLVRGLGGRGFDVGFSVGAEQARSRHTFRVADGRAGDPAPSTGRPLVRRRGLRLCAPCAHPLARRPRVLVGASARQSACPIAQPCTAGTGRGAGSHAWGRCMRQRALVVLGFATPSRGVLAVRGAKAAGARLDGASRGPDGRGDVHAEGSRATSQGCGEVVDMRGSDNDAASAS